MTNLRYGVLLVIVTLTFGAKASAESAVQMAKTTAVIPTYPLGEPDKDPIFYAGRRYQGAQGRVYPYAMLDKLGAKRTDRRYESVRLENQYLQFTILPELGGRIFTGLDKTNGYDFFYRQHVIKPALVGMAGAWISGGVEWNIPHHHRATTFMPVDCRLVENPDGSKTVWVGEIELRHRTQWIVGLTLFPSRSYLEVTTKLFNRTPLPISMLCFANAAVPVNRDYQVIFPPNTQFGVQHAKREFVHWPIGREVYNGLDRTGIDQSWWKNQPSPISIFAWNYEDDFVGGYDHGRQAGVIHVADHHVAPGKKFFTWGCGDEGKMWDKVLTDGDGPYIELMAGAYSDNQPDYSWVEPYETREVHEFWYPVRGLGGVKNANREAAVNLEIASGMAKIAVNTTQECRNSRVTLTAAGKTIFEQTAAIAPDRPFAARVAMPAKTAANEIRLAVLSDGKELIHYQPAKPHVEATPKPVVPPAPPKDIATNDELYQIGLRLEQFHNPTLSPLPYYEEAIRRDPGDSRVNTALGVLYCRRGMFAEAERHLRTAIARITERYTTPQNAEAFFDLGVALTLQEKDTEAAEAFYKATWDQKHSAAAFYALAENACRGGDYAKALELLEQSFATNAANIKAAGLKAMALRKLGRRQEALAVIQAAQQRDPLDYWTANEACLIAKSQGDAEAAKDAENTLKSLLRGDAESYLELAADYAQCHAWADASDVLSQFTAASPDQRRVAPMIYYDLAFYADRQGRTDDARRYWHLAAATPRDGCFPHRLESIAVLERAMAANPGDANALYYLGNLLYDIQPRRAIAAWERSRTLDPHFAMVHRNLGLAYAQTENNASKAAACYAAAVALDPSDSRALGEYDQIAEAAGIDPAARLAVLEKNAATAAKRDDTLLRQVSLCNLLGRYEESLRLLTDHHFRRWEGDNGPHAMFVDAHLCRGLQRLAAGKASDAKQDFAAALDYPDNFEIGRPLHGDVKSAQIAYCLGLADEALGQHDEAAKRYRQAAAADVTLPPMSFYRALAHDKLGDHAAARGELTAMRQKADAILQSGGHLIDFFGIFGVQQQPALQKAEAHYWIGLDLLGTGHATDARREFQLAAQLNPNHLPVQTMLAYCGNGRFWSGSNKELSQSGKRTLK